MYTAQNRQQFYTDWTTALRSGQYKQCSGGLQSEGSFCCLGVACDLLAKAGQGTWGDPVGRLVFPLGSKIVSFTDGVNPESGVIPKSLQILIGLTARQQDKLIVQNDDTRLSFHEIAHHIEQSIMPTVDSVV